ncbi:MAG: PAS domain S-box protein [Betaproteobacteria bacterium]|nr:PAS domain S-box protein [Betaproteobacteria bacterium]
METPAPFVIDRSALGGQGWYWILPRVAIALFVLALIALLWQMHRQDLEEQRATLISDILWVEQDLRFQLSRSAEQLAHLGQEFLGGDLPARRFELAVKALVANTPGLVEVLVVDASGQARAAAPAPDIRPFGATEGRGIGQTDAFRLARNAGRSMYGPPYVAAEGKHHFDIYVPLYLDGQFAGAVIGIYALPTLIAQQVPWWFAERYRVVVVDDSGNVLASKSNVEAGTEGMRYQVPFEPPGQGLLLQAIAYRSTTGLWRNTLALTIVGLALAVLVSLWLQRRQMLRRLAAESALSNEHAFRKAMEDSLLTGMRARDLEGRVVYVNPAFCRMVGWSSEELIGLKPPMPYWAPEEYEATLAVHQQVLAGKAPAQGVEVRLQRRNGERFDALIYEAPLIDADGRHTGWMGSVLDITERKRAEELARQQQEKLQFTSRLVTMGEMASTLAHELNQPLSAIASYTTGCLNLLEQGEINPPALREALQKSAHQAQRAGRIIRRVHEFVKKRESRLAACAINDVIEDAQGLIEADARKRGVRVTLVLGEYLPELLVDRVMIEQVLLNLMRNGMDAMAQTSPTERELIVSSDLEGEGVRVSVADHGPGIAPEVAAHLYEPFFTTKSEGMGMGLNICRSIVEFHQGRLWHEPREAGGTVFHLTLGAGTQ